jgi:hypothetical protein
MVSHMAGAVSAATPIGDKWAGTAVLWTADAPGQGLAESSAPLLGALAGVGVSMAITGLSVLLMALNGA